MYSYIKQTDETLGRRYVFGNYKTRVHELTLVVLDLWLEVNVLDH